MLHSSLQKSVFSFYFIYTYILHIFLKIYRTIFEIIFYCVYFMFLIIFFFFFATACLFKVRDFPKIFRQYKVRSDSLRPHRLYSPWNSPWQNTGVDDHSLLQGIFPTQESNQGLLCYRQKVKESESEVAQSCPTLCDPLDCSPAQLGFCIHGILQARTLEWVGSSFSRRSSWPRDWTQVSRIASRRFNLWATREADSLITKWVTKEALRQYTYWKLRMSFFFFLSLLKDLYTLTELLDS